ncbi:MAG: AAA family ATPase [Devosia sp.]|nr:AAA family ATPase [Devosia sp.]
MIEAAPSREADQLEGAVEPEQNLLPVVGHEAATGQLAGVLEAGRLPGAILLSGPRGIGKATLAFALARQVLTRTGDEDAHRVDEQVVAGAHPNLFALRRQPREGKGFYTVIRVDEVRQLKDRLHRTRGRAGHRIAIVDAIDDCNPSAANALLKTLEEPPAETLFLLVSHRPGLLLPTIKSRCLRIALRPLENGDVKEILVRQRPGDDAHAIDHAVALAEGRPRRAFEALALNQEGALTALRDWLRSPAAGRSATHLAIADALIAEAGGAETSFAREMITDWLAGEARAAAIAGPSALRRLASANELWEKAHALFADQESLNLDARQTLIGVFDAIRQHVHRTASLTEPL